MKSANLIRLVLGASIAIASTHAALGGDAPAKFEKGILVSPNGITLYSFDKDRAAGGKSMCNAQCATVWPPFAASTDAGITGEFSVITRDDGGKQFAHKGQPLYFYASDQKPGDMNGDGSGGVWHVIRTAKQSAAEPTSYSYGGY